MNMILDLAGAELFEAVRSCSPSKGLTHAFYRYPARFSPEFARCAIQTFSKHGDVVLDPFMGSGTVLVEALAAGRHAIGSDVSSLAHFITKVKVTPLAPQDINTIRQWSKSINVELILRRVETHSAGRWSNISGTRNLPWNIREMIALALTKIDALENARQRNFVKCALLRTAQWAVDCTRIIPQAAQFRSKFAEVLNDQLEGIAELAAVLRTKDRRAVICCLNAQAVKLRPSVWQHRIKEKPILVLTSPPYPGVHVLYHRWQVNGRKETPAPFWITGTLDGQGESHYTMGGRTLVGEANYFKSIRESFSTIHGFLAKDAIVVQLIAFSSIRDQLPKYLRAMTEAGYTEVKLNNSNKRVWRQVPLRKWYASLQGNTSSSRELLLIHQRLA